MRAERLEATLPTTPDASPADAGESVLELREVIGRMQAELQFEKASNEALNFEIARLKRWRFGSSSESLDTTTQAVLFDAILADTALEDRAAEEEIKPPAQRGDRREHSFLPCRCGDGWARLSAAL